MSSKKNKWAPSNVIRPKNFLVSSDAVANGVKPFIPSFEKDCNINMNFLMSNEYMKKWFEERKNYEKLTYTEGNDQKGDCRNKKKYIPRPKPKSLIRELPIITIQKFQNIPSKTDHRR